ncbi:hypothetical protein B0O80DRAFT_503072 [Mortierella sp. GBAus27b]|nr:hypothetical protein B0O80DRAFT_503072 [Mortierella sp. GBAus27b]
MVFIAKSVCLGVTIWSYGMSAQAPQSSETVSEAKDDKVVGEKWLQNAGVRRFPLVMSVIGLFETSVYIFLMSKASTPYFADNAAVQQLVVLKPWQVGFTVLAVAGTALRRWSYYALDRFFTYELAIRPGHRLISHGPYRFIRHPGYTGTTINGVCVYGLLWHEGLYDVLVSALSKGISWVLNKDVVVPTKILGIPGGILVTALYAYLMTKLHVARVRTEEAMLRAHFGEEWDLYAQSRWCFFPLVY